MICSSVNGARCSFLSFPGGVTERPRRTRRRPGCTVHHRRSQNGETGLTLSVSHHGKAEEGAVRGEVLRFHAGGTGAGRASWEKQQGAGRGRHPRSPLPGVWHIAPGWLRLIQELQVPGDVTLAKRFFGSHYL